MKKIIKSLALLLALVMLLSVVSVPAMASPSKTSLSPTYDLYVGNSSSAGVEKTQTFVRLSRDTTSGRNIWKYTSVGAFAYDISSIWSTLAANEGYLVKSATWKANVKYTSTSATSVSLNFYMIDTTWNESTFKASTLPATVTTYPNWTNAPDLTYEYRSAMNTTYVQRTYDLTALLNKHMTENENEANKNFFSFAVDTSINTGKVNCDIADTKDATNAEAILEVEYYKPVEEVDSTPILVSSSTEITQDTLPASLTALDSVADAKAVSRVANSLSSAKTIYIAAASYNSNGELLSVSMNERTIPAESTATVASNTISAQGAAAIKAFVWDSDRITPLAGSFTVGAAR